MRTFLTVVAGFVGLWFFGAGLFSVVITSRDGFIPALWTELLLGAAILAGTVFVSRRRTARTTGDQPVAADGASRPR